MMSKGRTILRGKTNIILADTNTFYGISFKILSFAWRCFFGCQILSLTYFVYNIDRFNDSSAQI